EWWSGGVVECLATIIVSLRDQSLVAGQTMDDQLPASCGISFEFKPSLFFAKGLRHRADYPNLRQQPRGRSSRTVKGDRGSGTYPGGSIRTRQACALLLGA